MEINLLLDVNCSSKQCGPFSARDFLSHTFFYVVFGFLLSLHTGHDVQYMAVSSTHCGHIP